MELVLVSGKLGKEGAEGAELQLSHWRSTHQTILSHSIIPGVSNSPYTRSSFIFFELLFWFLAHLQLFTHVHIPIFWQYAYYHAEFEWKTLSFWRSGKMTRLAHSKPTSQWQLPCRLNSIIHGLSVIIWTVKKVSALAVGKNRAWVALIFLRRSVSPFSFLHLKS